MSEDLAWMAGFWEADGTVTLHPHKNKASPTGYYFYCKFSFSQAENGKDILYTIQSILEKNGVKSTVGLSAKSTGVEQARYRCVIHKIDDNIKICSLLQPYIKMEKRKTQIMLTGEALDIIKNKEHLMKDGFMKLVDIMEETRKHKTVGAINNAKYTKKYFESLWKERGGFWIPGRGRRRVSFREHPRIIKLREQGMTLREIGEQYGIKPQSVHYILEKNKKRGGRY